MEDTRTEKRTSIHRVARPARQALLAALYLAYMTDHAVEGSGVNAIPEALADMLARQLGWPADNGIVQINIVAHTGADGFSRLARQARFDGDAKAGKSYLLTDDFVGQ